MCTFVNLSIEGSTHQTIYIVFVSEGNNAFTPWRVVGKKNSIPLFKYQTFYYPIKLNYRNENIISIVETMSSNENESRYFEGQPKIMITDTNGKFSSRLICFAMMREFNK